MGEGELRTIALLRATRTASDRCWLVISIEGASSGYARGSVASREIPSGISTLKSGSVGCIVRETVRLPEEEASETTRDEAYRLRCAHGQHTRIRQSGITLNQLVLEEGGKES